MKKVLFGLLLAIACLLGSESSVAQGRNKAFTIDMSKIKPGTNLIYSDAEVKIFARYEKGKPTVYTAQKPDGTKMDVKFESDVVAAGVASSSAGGSNGNMVSSGTQVSTSPHGKTIEGGNTKQGNTSGVASTSYGANSGNKVSSGTQVSTSPHGKTIEGGNTKQITSAAVASTRRVTCTVTGSGMVCK